MKLAVAAALALLALPTAAHAGGYVSVGVGTGPRFTNGLQNSYSGDGHNSARVLVGKRFGLISIEGGIGGYGLHGVNVYTSDISGDRAYSASASVVGQVPVMAKLEVFARLGIEKTWVTGEADDRGISGGGYLVGAGVAYDLGFRNMALWAEIDHEMMRLKRESIADQTGSVDTLMVGIRVGFGL